MFQIWPIFTGSWWNKNQNRTFVKQSQIFRYCEQYIIAHIFAYCEFNNNSEEYRMKYLNWNCAIAMRGWNYFSWKWSGIYWATNERAMCIHAWNLMHIIAILFVETTKFTLNKIMIQILWTISWNSIEWIALNIIK